MLVEFLLSLFALLLVLLYLYYIYSYAYWKKRNIPQIDPIFPYGSSRIINSGFNLGAVTIDFYKEFKKQGLKYGGIFVGPSPRLVLLDLDLIKEIFIKDFFHFTGRGIYFNEKEETIFAGLFNLAGWKWWDMRRKLTPTFTTGKIKSMFETMVECAKRMEESLLEKEQCLEVKTLCSCFTMDAAVCCFFGIDCDSFKNPNADFRVVGKKTLSVDVAMRIKRFLGAAAPELAGFLGFRTLDEEAINKFHGKMLEIISSKEADAVKHEDFLQKLMDTKVSTAQIVSESFFFYLAGFETSAIPMCFCLYELARNQEIQQKVREEIEEVLNRNGGQLTYDGAKEMKYLGQVIDETQRMYPAVPTLTRKCDEAYHLPHSNLLIERGMHLVIPLYAIHHDESYHQNPLVFDPDRFGEENKKKIPPFAYMPFGDGRKLCVGNRFALVLLKVGLCTLLKNFEFTISSKMQPVEIDKSAFLLASKSPVLLEYKRIK